MSNISIDFTESDLRELLIGVTFDWTYLDENGNKINVHLYNSDLGGEDE